MRIAGFSDVHGNIEAMCEVLTDVDTQIVLPGLRNMHTPEVMKQVAEAFEKLQQA